MLNSERPNQDFFGSAEPNRTRTKTTEPEPNQNRTIYLVKYNSWKKIAAFLGQLKLIKKLQNWLVIKQKRIFQIFLQSTLCENWEVWNKFLFEIMGQKLIKIVKIWKNGSVLVRLTEPAGSAEPPNLPNHQVRPNQNQNQKGSVVH